MKTKLIISNKIITLFLTFMLILSGELRAQDNQNKLLPSEALTLMIHAAAMNPELKRIDATKPYLSRVITTDLSREEQYILGDIYFWNFMPDESFEMFSKFLDDNNDLARASWQRVLQIRFRAYNEHDKVEGLIKEFREKFKPDPRDRFYVFGQTLNLGRKYAEEVNHERVLSLINEELETLNYEGAYRSFELPGFFFESYEVLGKKKEALTLLKEAKKGLELTLSERKKNLPEKDLDYLPLYATRASGMENIVTDKLSYGQMNGKFEELIDNLSNYIEKYR